MSFSLLSRSWVHKLLDIPRRGQRAISLNAKRKERSLLRGVQPLEERRLLSINPNGAEIFVNQAPAAQSGNQDNAAVAVQPLTNNGTTATPAVNSVVVWESDLEDGNGDAEHCSPAPRGARRNCRFHGAGITARGTHSSAGTAGRARSFSA